MSEQKNIYEGLTEQVSGQITATTITDVNVGTTKELLPQKMIDNSKYPIDLNAMCIKVTCDNGAVDYFNLPNDSVIKRKSKLYRFKKTYGKYPELNMQVNTQTDDMGFERIVY